jgi:tetratricopeptide (TPR) repeat protein
VDKRHSLADHATMSEGLDFFVSYTQADKPWAVWLAWQLEERGYSTNLQEWDFGPGTNLVLEMQRAAETARRTLALLSPQYLSSKFCRAEWAAAFNRDPAGEHRTLVHVRVTACEPRALLGPIVYIDLVGKDEAAARAALLAGVQLERRKPAFEPPFPGAPVARQLVGAEPPFPMALARVSNLPFPHNPYFTGRDAELGSLRSALAQSAAAPMCQPQVICGLGGVGKTQLAIEYAWQDRARYDALLWVPADTPASLRENLGALSGPAALALPAPSDPTESASIEATLSWLSSNRRWLLVIDNVDSEAVQKDVLELLPRLTLGHVLFTSRLACWPLVVQSMSLDVLSEGAAAALLLERTKELPWSRAAAKQNPRAHLEEAIQIARTLGCLPLALEQAGAYIHKHQQSFRHYLERMSQARHELFAHPSRGATGLHGARSAVATTWSISEAELSAAARVTLRLVAFFAPEGAPRAVFSKATDIFAESLACIADEAAAPLRAGRWHMALRNWLGLETPSATATEAVGPQHIDGALVELKDYSLIQLNPTSFSCHRVLMAVQQDRLTPDARNDWLHLALRILEASMPDNSRDARTWPEWEALSPHLAAAVASADEASIAEPTARIMNELGIWFKSRAKWEAAERLFRRAFAIDESRLGPEHPTVATYLNNLATLLVDTHRLTEAEPLMRRALAIDETCLGPVHPDVARDLNNLATLLQDTHRLIEAERLMRRALEILQHCTERNGHNHPLLRLFQSNYEALLSALG